MLGVRRVALACAVMVGVAGALAARGASAGSPHPERIGAGVVRPIRVLLIGDSLMKQSEAHAQAGLAQRGGFQTLTDARFGTGLINGFDWRTEMSHQIATYDPDVVVVEFVGNYLPPYLRRPDGSEILPGSNDYFARWSAAANDAMRRLSARGATVYWVLGPHMRDPGLDRMHTGVDLVYVGLRHGWSEVRFVDVYRVLSTPDGRYADTLPGPNGQPEKIRSDDGVHLTDAGARRFAGAVVDRLDADWRPRVRVP